MQQQSSLKKKTVNGLLWSFVDLMANQGIQFIVQIILARLLLPEAFGIIGMILIFIALSNSIIESGFTQALVREQNTTQEDYSTVFHFNLVIAFLMYIVLYTIAPSISSFFEEPQLVAIIRVMSLVLLINSFAIIQRVHMIKAINFRLQTKISLIAGISSGIIAIASALLGFGVWSLVIRTLLLQLFLMLLLWLFNRWVPSLVFDTKSFKRLFKFGSKLLIAGLIDSTYKNIYFVIIGKFYTPTQLGYYTNAAKLKDMASIAISSSVQRVTYPVLSKIKEEEERLKEGFKKVIKASAYLNFPLMIGLAAIGGPLINFLLGPQWENSVIYFQLLCIAGMLYPIHSINLNILQVKGRSDLFLKLEIYKKALLTILIILAVWFDLGIIGLIMSAVLNSYISLFINTYFSAKEISYSIKEQLADLLPIYVMSILMGGIVYISGFILPDQNFLKMTLQIFIGCGFYICISILMKSEELNFLYSLIKPSLRKVKLL